MANIVYSMSGEGRGHATRARAVVEAMRGRHQLTLFASDCAYEMLSALYEDTEVSVLSVPGLRFAYNGPGRVNLLGTVALATQLRFRMKRHVTAALRELDRIKPDLVIADFEPILPRAARVAGVPFVSFDHQHYLVVSDLSDLPFWLRQQANLAAPFVRSLYNWQRATIVSSFYAPPLKRAYRDTTWVGTLMRPEVLRAQPEPGDHLLAYIRRHAAESTLGALAASGREVRVYGLGAQPSQGALRFLPIDERAFLSDLATCTAVVTTAGNQLVGEAMYLGKPLLVMPEKLNFEQAVNAHFLEQSGAGWAERTELTPERLAAFIDAVPMLRQRIRRESACGNQAAVEALERQLYIPRLPAAGSRAALPPSGRAGVEGWRLA
jgi:uncharacterized protein (TIGR00661 family)